MDETRMAGQNEEIRAAEETGAPVTQAEREQSGHALWELAYGEVGRGLGIPSEHVETARPFFELGWAMGVRTGHGAPALAGVPVDRAAVARAFALLSPEQVADGMLLAVARTLDPEHNGPILWQKVDYHGSHTGKHGTYWVTAIHAHADPFGDGPEVRYDISEQRGAAFVVKLRSVRRESITPLPYFQRIFA
ncbi:hypothetical protein [Streptomyces minutiscleroticus]|uniref:hypothetical protein n=1 Tax=Streptomyces minutiscleroticus TaxID=68238 RepID=UPI003320F5C1